MNTRLANRFALEIEKKASVFSILQIGKFPILIQQWVMLVRMCFIWQQTGKH